MRRFGGVAARRISSTSRPSASARLRAWLRWLAAWMMMAPSSVQRRPARRRRRAFTGSGRLGERAASKRRFTAVSTLFTFCPPGPEANKVETADLVHILPARAGGAGKGLDDLPFLNRDIGG